MGLGVSASHFDSWSPTSFYQLSDCMMSFRQAQLSFYNSGCNPVIVVFSVQNFQHKFDRYDLKDSIRSSSRIGVGLHSVRRPPYAQTGCFGLRATNHCYLDS